MIFREGHRMSLVLLRARIYLGEGRKAEEPKELECRSLLRLGHENYIVKR
jgi:hypothetical protein